MGTETSISRAADWRRVRTEGKSGRCGDLRVQVAPREGTELPSRLGLRVRSGGPARAVRRNRARRRLREAWRAAAPEKGLDVVVYADGTYADKNFQKVRGELISALERAQGPS